MPRPNPVVDEYLSRIENQRYEDVLRNISREVIEDPKLSPVEKQHLQDTIVYKVRLLFPETEMMTGVERYAQQQRSKALTSLGIDPTPAPRPDKATEPRTTSPRQPGAAQPPQGTERPAPPTPAKPAAMSRTVTEGFSPADIDAGVKAVKKDSAERLIVKDAAELYNVPEGFIVVFIDPQTGRMSPYILKPGILWKLRDWGFRSVDVEIVPDPDKPGGYLGTCKIAPNLQDKDYQLLQALAGKIDAAAWRQVYDDLMRPTVAHSSANSDNLKDKQRPWAREIAETRATLRAARVFTGCGLSTPEDAEDQDGDAA